jgi:hypothetical protein
VFEKTTAIIKNFFDYAEDENGGNHN